jgi:hypothetical protein
MRSEIESTLHDSASAATGLDDFGDECYREGLGRLLDALARVHPDLGEFGAAAEARALGPLIGRLWSEQGWQRRPECRTNPVVGPVVITGIPRTGTTLLHKMLSLDDRYQVLQNWIIPNPMVRPPRERWNGFAAYQAAGERFAQAPELMRKTHLVRPEEADECLLMMAQSFASNMFGSLELIPDYDEWFLATDMTPSFLRLAENLRLIGADDADRPWLLKNPSHVLALDDFFAVFPDARVVQTHRDPQVAMGSVVSLLSTLTGQRPEDRAARELSVWGEGMRRTDAARARRSERFYDVDYRELVADPVGVAVNLSAWLGVDLNDGVRARMRAWVEDNPQGQHGEHRYDPAELGVTAAAVERQFGDYADRYGLM